MKYETLITHKEIPSMNYFKYKLLEITITTYKQYSKLLGIKRLDELIEEINSNVQKTIDNMDTDKDYCHQERTIENNIHLMHEFNKKFDTKNNLKFLMAFLYNYHTSERVRDILRS